ncbi:MAG: molybdopterin-binding/glycosyltransferase family 2 protein [Rhizobiaceae bacterium]
MKFGPVPIDRAEGATVAHSVRTGEVSFSKGRVLSADDIDALGRAGIDTVVVARLDAGDVGEDEAARRIAGAMTGSGFAARAPATGRVNLHAGEAGVLIVDRAMVDRLNAIDPAITFATLDNHAPVTAGQMVATVKIIPFAVSGVLVDAAVAACAGGDIMTVHAYRPRGIGLVQTELAGTKPTVLDKTARTTKERLARSGSLIVGERRCAHEASALAGAIGEVAGLSDMVIVFGASATSDADDVIPAAIAEAGGTVVRVGMPVDPGNLITLGTLDGKPVIGAPGCARSPKENGFDWVLDRTIAGIDVSAADIGAMGVGGLLAEIPARPRPREAARRKASPKLHAVLLAAGRSSRMGGPNKLLATFDGEILVRRVAARIIEAGLAPTVVTGHQRERIEDALAGLDVMFAHNDAFAEGLSGSLKVGMNALPEAADGALIVLADMPGLRAADIKALCEAFAAAGGGSIIRATHAGKRGNPVILPRSVFAQIEAIAGDTGARAIIESGATPVIDVEIGQAASLDVDTPTLLGAAGGKIAPQDG